MHLVFGTGRARPPAPTGVTPSRNSPRPQTPITRQRKAHNLRTGRAETWEAWSAGDEWWYERNDDDGTDWTVTHLPTGLADYGYGTLSHAREATATGLLDRLIAAAEKTAAEKTAHPMLRDTARTALAKVAQWRANLTPDRSTT